MNKINRVKELVKILNEASKAYYHDNIEIMSNYEYDKLYDELEQLEKETGMILSDSPTQKVGYEVLDALPKERHPYPMLSLDKTKEVEVLKDFLKNQKGILSWKLDGLTIVLTYQDGQLVKAVTRGNGEIGEVITNNAKVFKNVPLTISYKDELVIRGEAIIKYSDFERLNKELGEEEQYKNPRNLCSGSVRQLNNKITAERNVHFYAFQVVTATGVQQEDSKKKRLEWLESLGFSVVENYIVDADTVEKEVQNFASKIADCDLGSDGLVLTYDSVSYSNSLGATSKFPKDSIAFKWKDEIATTRLKEIEWSASRTGLINPVAIFEPVELEGTTVTRASVHNISILEALELGIGDEIEVYKANMIIPQIADNLTRSNSVKIPKKCPVCHEDTEIKQVNQVKALYCVNDECPAKKIKRFTHFVSRDAMNIDGLSEATLEKFVQKGFIHTLDDLYKLERFEDEIVNMDGFGRKSYTNLINAVEKSKQVALPNFIFALGILNVGLSNAKLLTKAMGNDLDAIMDADVDTLMAIPGFGGVIANTLVSFFANKENREEIERLRQYMKFENDNNSTNQQLLEGKTFVVTGSLNHFENRNALKDMIENLGGKVTGSVTNKTDYLINNDVNSSSSKNKTAKSLGIPIISEDDFLEMVDNLKSN